MFDFIDPISLAIGAGSMSVLGPVAINIIVKLFPVTAPIFAKLSLVQRQLLKLMNESEHIDEQKVIEHAKESGLKGIAKMIQKSIKKKNA